MKFIYNSKVIPFPGYRAINLFNVLFIRGDKPLSDITINHEKIHSKQIVDVMLLALIPYMALFLMIGKFWLVLPLWIFSYYEVYLIEWFIRLFMKGRAYRNISFEREAYANEKNLEYLKERKLFSFIKYIKE